jgi:predicted dehydrogenase
VQPAEQVGDDDVVQFRHAGVGQVDDRDRAGPEQVLVDERAGVVIAAGAEVVDAVRENGPSACTLDEARAALLVALAADRSRAERRPVAIEEVTSANALAG